MTNDVPATRTPPDVGLLLAGNALASRAYAPLARASNFTQAHTGSGTPRVSQSFARRGTGPTGVCVYTSGAASPVAGWWIPATRGATSVDCYIVGSSVGGGGTAEFRSTTGAAVTGLSALPAAVGLVGPLALTIDASGGSEEVNLWLDASGGNITVDSVLIVVPPQSSPLGAGLGDDGCVAFDADEFQADEPLSADAMQRLRANAAALRQVPHVFWNWSGLTGVTLGTDALYMHAEPHVMPAPVWPDTDRDELAVTIKAKAYRTASDTHVRVHAATGCTVESIVSTCEIVVTGGATGLVDVSGTMRLPKRRYLRNVAAGLSSINLLVWPEMAWPGNTSSVAALTWWQQHTGGVPEMLTTAKVNRLSVWGI